MWAVHTNPPTPSFPFIPRPTKGFVFLSVSATSHHRSSPNPKKQQQQHQRIKKHERENESQRAATNQLSGLDVLWAMQRASAEKSRAADATSKNNRKRKTLFSAGGHREENQHAVDYSNVRPLCINSEWGDRLDELEKRLQDLSETR